MMLQIVLNIDDSVADRLDAVAKASRCSTSDYVTALVMERFSEEEAEDTAKKQILKELRGAIKDSSFVEPPEIPWDVELPRRFDLL